MQRGMGRMRTDLPYEKQSPSQQERSDRAYDKRARHRKNKINRAAAQKAGLKK